MTKKFLIVFLSVLTTICFVSCKDDISNDIDSDTSDVVPNDDYTVIFIGNMGNNDKDVYYDFDKFLQYRESGNIGDKINVTGVVKSTLYQDELRTFGFDGTVEFTLGHYTGHSLDVDSSGYEGENSICLRYKKFCEETNAKRVGGADYDITSVAAISSVIKKAANEHPAKNYVLLLLGHGNGFNPLKDKPNAAGYTLRSCVSDAATNTYITCDNLVAAVNASGVKIQTIFFQNCQMASLENLAAYQHCTDYAFASSEVTESFYMQEFIAGLKSVGTDTEKLKKMANGVVDYYIDEIKETAGVDSEGCPYATSHGFYDLSKMPEVLSVVKDIAAWYADAADKDSLFISGVIEDVNYCCNFDKAGGLYYGCFLKYELKDFINQKITKDDNLDQVYTKNVKRIASIISYYSTLMVEGMYTDNFTFAHLMKVTLDRNLEANAILDFTALQKLYNRYISAIKDMAYIRANHVDNSVTDYEYIYASPSVCLFSLDKEHYVVGKAIGTTAAQQQDAAIELLGYLKNQDEIAALAFLRSYFGGNPFAHSATYDVTKASYCGSQFDLATGWSNFLMKLKNNPSSIINPSRISDKVMEYYSEHMEEIFGL